MEIILIIYFFIIGAIFGSFLNMLVYRVNKGQNLLGRSYCDITKKPLKPVDLVPILSYLIFKGIRWSKQKSWGVYK
jgi:prepilin signal peptidase PulO-like enzyme (type II secretory pathway)